jgi:hypothetical protein
MTGSTRAATSTQKPSAHSANAWNDSGTNRRRPPRARSALHSGDTTTIAMNVAMNSHGILSGSPSRTSESRTGRNTE